MLKKTGAKKNTRQLWTEKCLKDSQKENKRSVLVRELSVTPIYILFLLSIAHTAAHCKLSFLVLVNNQFHLSLDDTREK